MIEFSGRLFAYFILIVIGLAIFLFVNKGKPKRSRTGNPEADALLHGASLILDGYDYLSDWKVRMSVEFPDISQEPLEQAFELAKELSEVSSEQRSEMALSLAENQNLRLFVS